MNGKQVAVIDVDGSNYQAVTSSNRSSGHFWRDDSGNDWVVYLGELENKNQGGSTWRVRIDSSTNAAIESSREKLNDEQYSAGLGGSGVYLAESYGKSYLYNLQTRQKSVHLNGVQNCVGSAHAGSKPWMMYERDVEHHHVVISEWKESSNTARYIWQYDAGSKVVFAQWSQSDERYATIQLSDDENGPSSLQLVKLQIDSAGSDDNQGSYQQAAMGIDHNYIGGVWIGDSFSSPTATAPDAPAQLQAGAVSASRVDLTWQDRSSDESGFKIERRTGSGSFAELGTVSADTTSYADRSVQAATTYTYRVRAYNPAGNSSYSNQATAKTAEAPVEQPSPPDQLTANATSDGQVNLSWHDQSDNAAGFAIERKIGSEHYHEIARVDADVTTYTDGDALEPSTRYSYRVRAYNGAGNSDYSEEANATTSAPLTGKSITILYPRGGESWPAGSVQHIRWSAVDISDVTIRYTTNSGGSWQLVEGSVDDGMDTWGDYPWTVPVTPSSSCAIKIAGYFGEVPTTSGPFTIEVLQNAGRDGGAASNDADLSEPLLGDDQDGQNSAAARNKAHLSGGCTLAAEQRANLRDASWVALLALLLAVRRGRARTYAPGRGRQRTERVRGQD